GRWQPREHGLPVRFRDGAVVVDCGAPAVSGYTAAGWATGASGVRGASACSFPVRISARVSTRSAGNHDGLLAAIALEPERPDAGWILYLVRTRRAVELRGQDLRDGGRDPVLIGSVDRLAPWPEAETITLAVTAGRCRVTVDGTPAFDLATPPGI